MYVLSELLDGCPNAKIIEVILENYNEELTINEVAEMAGLSFSKADKYLWHLRKKGIINLVKMVKLKGPIYKFNKDNPISKALVLLEHQIVTTGLEKAIKEYKNDKN